MKIQIFYSPKNYLLLKEVFENLKLQKLVHPILNDDETMNVKNYETILTNRENQSLTKTIIIEEFGILAFMYLTKHPQSIVALIEDEHSATMTALHNNTNILIIPTATVTINVLQSILIAFLNTKFEAGRHHVRLEMLNKMLKE